MLVACGLTLRIWPTRVSCVSGEPSMMVSWPGKDSVQSASCFMVTGRRDSSP
jgi:hypothetical protein